MWLPACRIPCGQGSPTPELLGITPAAKLMELGARKSLAMFGYMLRALPNYPREFKMVTAGVQSLYECYWPSHEHLLRKELHYSLESYCSIFRHELSKDLAMYLLGSTYQYPYFSLTSSRTLPCTYQGPCHALIGHAMRSKAMQTIKAKQGDGKQCKCKAKR